MDVAMREDLVAAGMEPAQAEVLATHMPDWPDWSQLATKADLQELATKADLKDLDQKFQGQMLGLQREMLELKTDLTGQMLELKTDLTGEMLELKTDLTGQMLELKSGLLWRLVVPVATALVGGFLVALMSYLLS